MRIIGEGTPPLTDEQFANVLAWLWNLSGGRPFWAYLRYGGMGGPSGDEPPQAELSEQQIFWLSRAGLITCWHAGGSGGGPMYQLTAEGQRRAQHAAVELADRAATERRTLLAGKVAAERQATPLKVGRFALQGDKLSAEVTLADGSRCTISLPWIEVGGVKYWPDPHKITVDYPGAS